MRQTVKTYSGARLHEDPLSFYWEGAWREVREVKSRWQSPEGLHFLVRDEAGGIFELSYQCGLDAWQVRPKQAKISPT